MKKQLRQAVTLYESFREAKPRRLAKLRVDIPRVVACMGHVEGIDYRTTHAGKTELYRHRFAKGSRPLLCVSSDGRQLMLLGGLYKWTERGIVDRDRSGRERPDPKHGRAINPKRVKCQWWAGCTKPAVTTEPHPVLGAVPICQRCKDKLIAIDGPKRRNPKRDANSAFFRQQLKRVKKLREEERAAAVFKRATRRNPLSPDTVYAMPIIRNDALLFSMVRGHGMTISKRDGEYRVAFPGRGNEDSAYYTTDRNDAYETAKAMRRRYDTARIKGALE